MTEIYLHIDARTPNPHTHLTQATVSITGVERGRQDSVDRYVISCLDGAYLILGTEIIKTVGKSQSCMVSKLPIIFQVRI